MQGEQLLSLRTSHRENLLEDQIAALQNENSVLRNDLSISIRENTLLQERVAQLLQVQGGGTKVDSPLVVIPPSKKARYSYISRKIILQFQPSVDPNDIPYEQIAWWKDIFSYIQPNDYERLHFRRLCNMFKASLKAPPKGKWTEYPHLNHTSIDSLFNRCKELHDEDPTSTDDNLYKSRGACCRRIRERR